MFHSGGGIRENSERHRASPLLWVARVVGQWQVDASRKPICQKQLDLTIDDEYSCLWREARIRTASLITLADHGSGRSLACPPR